MTDRLFTRRVMAAVRAEPPALQRYRRLRRRAAAAMIVTGVIVAVAVLGGADRQTVLVEGDSVSRDSAISTQSVAFEHSRAGDRARPMMQPSDPPLAADFIPVVESDGTKFSM